MFSADDLVTKTLDEMKKDIEDLMAESARLREEHDASLERSEKLRWQAVELRPDNPDLAEEYWSECERLKDDARELLRQSVEKRIRAGDIQHRIDIRAQIEAVDSAEEIWQKSVRAGRI